MSLKSIIALYFAIITAWSLQAQQPTLQSGDLLFVHGGGSAMTKAVSESTGRYTHVAMVEIDDTGHAWVVEATSPQGVRRIPFALWQDSNYGCFDHYRLIVSFDTTAVIARAHSFLGQPYDEAFLPDNGALYCSELIYECFPDLFEAKPMNWRNPKGRMPRYWKKHFKRLGMPVPEGVPGTNPTDMSHSPILKKL